jgi:starvation-inducible outer membrane lipoprotein
MHVLQKPETASRPRWPRRRIAIVAGAAALLLAIAAVLLVVLPGSAPPPSPLAYSAGCPQDPMQQVPNVGSYRVEVRCARIGGKVLAYRLNRSYDDLELTVSPDPAYQSLLPTANHGRFIVRITGP